MALTNGLLEHWRLDANSGNRVGVHDARTLSEAGASIGSAAGRIDQAADFPGTTGDFLQADNSSFWDGGTAGLTLAFWVQFQDTNPQRPLVTKWTDTNGPYLIDLYQGELRWFYRTDTDSGEIRHSTFTVQTGTWYLLRAWVDLNESRAGFQVNDETPLSKSVAGTSMRSTTSAFTVGAKDESNSAVHYGLLDSLSVWSRPLAAHEHDQLFNHGHGLDYRYFTDVGTRLPARLRSRVRVRL